MFKKTFLGTTKFGVALPPIAPRGYVPGSPNYVPQSRFFPPDTLCHEWSKLQRYSKHRLAGLQKTGLAPLKKLRWTLFLFLILFEWPHCIEQKSVRPTIVSSLAYLVLCGKGLVMPFSRVTMSAFSCTRVLHCVRFPFVVSVPANCLFFMGLYTLTAVGCRDTRFLVDSDLQADFWLDDTAPLTSDARSFLGVSNSCIFS